MERPRERSFYWKFRLNREAFARQTFLKSADALPEQGLAFSALNARSSS